MSGLGLEYRLQDHGLDGGILIAFYCFIMMHNVHLKIFKNRSFSYLRQDTFLYVDAADGEQVLSQLLTNHWNARRGHQNTADSCLHVFVFFNLAFAEDH